MSFDYRGPVHPPLYRLWQTLPGRYEATEAGVRLVIVLAQVAPYNLSLEARTLAAGEEIVEPGTLGLADASPSWTSTSMRFVVAYRPEGVAAGWGCGLYGAPTGDGMAFAAEAADCSFAFGRRIARLSVDADAAVIRVSGPGDSEPLVFTRVSTATP
jgi:hypothetical protein